VQANPASLLGDDQSSNSKSVDQPFTKIQMFASKGIPSQQINIWDYSENKHITEEPSIGGQNQVVINLEK